MTISKNNLKKHPIISFFMIIFVSVLFIGCNGETGSSLDPGSYQLVTADNVLLKLYRYRPADDAKFNKNRQPILLLPGVCMNMNEFLPHTTDLMKDVYSKCELPSPLAAWAVGDRYIKNDHLLLYNFGYYLWLKGYDPWFANFRGTGRDEYKSESGINATNLDVLGCLDVPALVQRVTELTGMKPVIGGHSTGGVACYIYLQGAYMDINEVMEGKAASPTYLPHVKVSKELAVERNNSVRGYLALDPACIPPLPEGLDTPDMWTLCYQPVVLPFDDIMQTLLVDSQYTGLLMTDMLNTLFGYMAREAIKDPANCEWLHFFESSNNVDKYVLDSFFRYAVSNANLRIFSQYYDWGMNINMREGWTNGLENINVVTAPAKKDGDGYYYYEDHMDNITTPTMMILSYYSGIVDTATVLKYIYDRKTRHQLDTYYEVPGTAHADLPIGYTAPSVIFPRMSDWLNKL